MKENELEFSDWPMFDLLMTNEELCRELLEVVLDAPVSNIEYIIAENDIRPTLTRRLRKNRERGLQYRDANSQAD